MNKLALLLLLLTLASCAQPAPIVRPAPTPSAAPTAASSPTAAATATEAPSATPAPTETPTPTAIPTPVPPWRFVVLGDTRTAGLDPPAVTGRIVELASAQRPALTLVTGDLINAMDDRASVREQWRRWRAVLAPLGEGASDPPWLLVTPGNHDVQGSDWATELMAEAFPELPANGPEGLQPLTYSVVYRNVRFISLQSFRRGRENRLGQTQLNWLERLLERNTSPYVIIFAHSPAYPVGPHIGNSLDVNPEQRDQFWALLKRYHVTAYIAGHEHLYSRTTVDGVPQLIVGASGSPLYVGHGGDFQHYLLAEVTPDGISMAVYDDTGQERDRFTLPERAAQP